VGTHADHSKTLLSQVGRDPGTADFIFTAFTD
jgi:hypothetical protein